MQLRLWSTLGRTIVLMAFVTTSSFAFHADAKTKIAKRSTSSGAHAHKGRLLAQNDTSIEDDLDAELNAPDESDSTANSDLDNALEESASETPTIDTPAEPVAESVATGEDVRISDIRYDSKTAGGTVVIATTGAATYRTREIPGQNQVVVEIANAVLPAHLKRPFNTKDFKQAIVSINAYQDAGSSTARVVMQFRQPRSVDVRQNGRTLTVVAAPFGAGQNNNVAAASSDDFGDDEEAAAEETASEPSQVSSYAAPKVTAPRARTSDGRVLPTSTLDQERNGDLRFNGKEISIEVRDTPVRDVISLIAEQSGANLILSDEIQGNVTIKLRQVPWDQALSIIMKTRGLGYVRQGAVLRIAPISRLQAEAEEARRIIEAQDATLPVKVKVIPVSFANVTTLVTQIRGTLQSTTATASASPGAAAPVNRGRIEADARSSSLIVTDTAENIRRIEELVAALDTPPLQVMIEGKIVEAREELGRNLGINWGYQGQDLGFAGGTLGHTAKISPTVQASNTTVDLRLGTLDFLGDLTAKLSLYEREAIAKIISSPRVITMNAQEATIEQSVNIPIPVTTVVNGTSQTQTNFRAVPTTLKVKPQITPGGDVLMEIQFRREFQAGGSGANVSIESRDVKTNVMVKNGQTTVIGGIYQADQNEQEEGTPFLRKVPVLGWLFKNKNTSSIKNELLVFLTPRILNADRNLPKGVTR